MVRSFVIVLATLAPLALFATSIQGADPSADTDAGQDTTYWAIVFSYQDPANRPRNSHTFATFVASSTQREIRDQFAISWMPAQGGVSVLATQPVRGLNRTLEQDLRRAQASSLRVSAWGPLRISPELFQRARARYEQLEAAETTGDVLYKAADGTTRRMKHQPAINCVHALSDIAGDLVTGIRRGDEASALVVQHFDRFVLDPDRSIDADWLVVALGLDKHGIQWRCGDGRNSPAHVTAVVPGSSE